MKSNHTIFIDMDGVLCDFVRDALMLHGPAAGVDRVIDDWPPGKYDMAEVLGMSYCEFWRPIDEAGRAFWADMSPTPHLLELMMMVCETDWYIASSPSLDFGCMSGKLRWLEQHINQQGGAFCKYVFTLHKRLLAQAGRVLIDDSDAEIYGWRKAGGHGILFPAKWNSDHKYADDPNARVREALERIGVVA